LQTFNAKALDRELTWAAPLPDEVKYEWKALQKDLCEVVTCVKIPRYYFENSDKNKETSLHIFVDASNRAYGACRYSCNGGRSTLVMAKHKVSPLKGTTLLKLELMAAVLGARLARDITETMLFKKVHFWNDSQIVFYWIKDIKPQTNSSQQGSTKSKHYLF
jgi:hypothetical protein